MARQGRAQEAVTSKSVRLAALLALSIIALSVVAGPSYAQQQQIRIGIGFGLAFLPLYISEDLKLVEKHAKLEHLDVKVSYQRFLGAGPIEEAIALGAIDVGPFGTAPLLVAWEKTGGTPQQILAVSGITTMPLALLSNQPGVQTIADLKPADRIALPSLTAPQMFVLELQSEKVFGQFDRLREQVVALPHPDSIAALIAATGPVTAYFSSPPFTQLALRDANIHKVLGSAEVMDGKASFLVLGATRSTIEAQPKMPEVIEQAIDEAARLIRDDPRRAAQIYLTHEPSKTLNAAAIETVLREIKDEFGSAVHGMQVMADFMGRHGGLDAPPRSWKDVVAPALMNSPGS